MNRVYVLIIEQAGDEPKVLVYDSEVKAVASRLALKNLTEGRWDDDPEWHNAIHGPIKASRTIDEANRILREVYEEITK